MSDDKHSGGAGKTATDSGAGCDDCSRRNLLIATAVVGGVAGVGTAIPFVSSFAPSERAKAAGAPVEADISKLAPGEKMIVEWQGKPVWIVRRTKEQLATLDKDAAQLADPNSTRAEQPAYIKGPYRSLKPEYLVCIGICTHLGCSPTDKFGTGGESGMGNDWQGGFLCPCHGSTFDLAARVFKNKPAPDNLPIPPHKYVGDTKLVIGEDTKGA